MKVLIIDYGMGNIKSIISSLKYLGVDNISVSNELEKIKSADKLILPGVGSFAKAMNTIRELNIDKYLQDTVLIQKKPILGICLGMQLMGLSSEEDGLNDGLKFISGKVVKFDSTNLKVPHVGFNQLHFPEKSRLYQGLKNLSDFYFTHSFKMDSDSNINQAVCDYGNPFVASYELDNIAGVQFHPELSQTNGLKLLENFIKSF